jgi:hypothetical protein
MDPTSLYTKQKERISDVIISFWDENPFLIQTKTGKWQINKHDFVLYWFKINEMMKKEGSIYH